MYILLSICKIFKIPILNIGQFFFGNGVELRKKVAKTKCHIGGRTLTMLKWQQYIIICVPVIITALKLLHLRSSRVTQFWIAYLTAYA